jgi:hypothetical protein
VLNITAPNGFINPGEAKERAVKLIKKFWRDGKNLFGPN